MSIGENIRRIRKENKMTQKELGEKLGGISQQQIGQWENGDKNPKIETIQKIALALHVTLRDLMPDTFEHAQLLGTESIIGDYDLLQCLANHKIFSEEEKAAVMEQIRKHKTALSEMTDLEQSEQYSGKTHHELEQMLLHMILKKHEPEMSHIIILLSCFFTLQETSRNALIDIILNTCYPGTDL